MISGINSYCYYFSLLALGLPSAIYPFLISSEPENEENKPVKIVLNMSCSSLVSLTSENNPPITNTVDVKAGTREGLSARD